MVRRDTLLRLYNNLLKRREELEKRLSADMRDLGGHGTSGDIADAAQDCDGDEVSSSLAEHERTMPLSGCALAPMACARVVPRVFQPAG